MMKKFTDALRLHTGTAVRLCLALVVMLLAACYLNGPRDAALGDLLQEFGASGCGILPIGFWKVLCILLPAGLALVPRGLGSLWNAVLCATAVAVTPWLLAMVFGANLMLPEPLDSNRAALAYMQMPGTHGALVFVGLAALVAALLCACNRVRVLVTALACFGLWFAASDLLWMLFSRDMQADALLYDMARSVRFNPWVCALLPGLFFGVFALLVCPLYAYSGTEQQEAAEQPSLPEPEPQEEERDILPAEIVEPAKPAPSLPEPTVVDVQAVVQKEDEPAATPPAP